MLCLVKATLAASTAILVIGLMRKPLRRAVGARAAYLVWLLVPCSVLALIVPAPSQPVAMVMAAVPHPVNDAIGRASLVLYGAQSSGSDLVVMFLAWLAGVAAMSAVAVRRQRHFVRSLGRLALRQDGTYRSECGLEPMLVGFWRPRIVLPADFEARYTPEEASWVLAHERAHLQRGDALVNALATGLLCVFWFNPLIYLAVGWLRFDQDLAADALALAAAGTSRRGYANALLKTQLICDSAWRLPVGCQWQSSHPLKERIGMLRRPLPGNFRRSLGISLTLASIACSVCAVWAAQPARESAASGTPIAIHIRWLLNGEDLLAVKGRSSMPDFLVSEGVDFVRSSTSPGHVQQLRCVVSLPSTRHASRGWNVPGIWQKFKKTGKATDGVLLVQCIWRENGKIVMQPSLFFRRGEPAAAEVTDGVTDRRLEFKAATSPRAAMKAQSPGYTRINLWGQWKVCLVTTSCWALARKTPPRLCPDGALSCARGAGRVIPLALRERPLPFDR
ncbi:MAG TPA: M56 family metallopeptidase [Steroidobacteraceae bacterium]|nr:M56 family metallopeptidase [Steroidobacteraceae bacterium]